MIKYNLKCKHKHEFESWFSDSKEFEKLKSKKISGILNDMNVKNLTEWIASHNASSTLSAKDNKNSKNIVQPKLFGNSIERLRFFKYIYYLFPSSIRPFLLFIIKYFFFLGFLDGKIGFYYCFFHSLWFRTLIDAKIFEKKCSSKISK